MPRGIYIRTDDVKKKMSESHKNQIPWNKGKKSNQIPWNKGKKMTDEMKHKLRMAFFESKKIKEYWDNYIHVTKEEKCENNKAYRLSNGDKVKKWKRNDYERNRKEYKDRANKYYLDNKEAKKEYSREYQKNNIERVLARIAKWGDNNPERLRLYRHNRRFSGLKTKSKVTHKDIIRQSIIQDNQCFWCSKKLKDYHIDHVIPLSKGGLHTVGNIVIACPTCNLRKNKKFPIEFKMYIKAEMDKSESMDKAAEELAKNTVTKSMEETVTKTN